MKKLFLFLALLFAAGCASVSVQKYYKDVVYPATNPASIVVFPQKPSGKIFTPLEKAAGDIKPPSSQTVRERSSLTGFTEIGEITVTGANDWGQIESIFRTKAAEMGADAVYVFSKQEETRRYLSPDDCYVRHGYYYPYQHFGWRRYRPGYYYPRGYYYCYGYQSTIETATFISAVGIAIKYTAEP